MRLASIPLNIHRNLLQKTEHLTLQLQLNIQSFAEVIQLWSILQNMYFEYAGPAISLNRFTTAAFKHPSTSVTSQTATEDCL